MPSILISAAAVEREAQIRARLAKFGFSQTHMNALKLYNSHQPYHNWHHCAVVALNSLEAAQATNVPVEKQRLLLLAGLYHDYDHTGQPAKADIFNIVRAVSGAAFWLDTVESGLTLAEKNEVANLIAATESSHALKPRTMLEGILQDADLLATAGSDREQWWAALSKELGVNVNSTSTLNFLRSQNFHSLWGMQHAAAVLQELQALTAQGR